MTVAENLARLFPLHYQRIVELSHRASTPSALKRRSQGRWRDLAGLFIWDSTEEGYNYWQALAS